MSFAGWPAMSVPLCWSREGLPVGCHFAAATGEDALLFSLAFQLEEAAPWQPTLTELAEDVGVTIVNLSVLKNGRARAVRFSTLTALCRALDCQPGDLLTVEVPE